MNASSTDRIPVVFGAVQDVRPDDALLIEGDAAAPPGCATARIAAGAARAGHDQGCLCCVPRGGFAEALGRLYIASVRAALACDVLTAARFRPQ
jgi:hypothetical protein